MQDQENVFYHKFIDALKGTIDHVKTELLPEYDFSQMESTNAEKKADSAESELKWE